MTTTFDVDPAILARVQKMPAKQLQMISELLTPRTVDEFMPHMPHPPQQVFMGLRNREVMFGGAAGGGKSDALLMAALQYVDIPGYSALILRRTYADLVLPGAIMDRAKSWWGGTRAKAIDGGKEWRFPGGGRITFGYLQNSNDKYRYASAEYQFIGFDELTQFQEEDYTFLFSRLRKPAMKCLICKKKIKLSSAGTWLHNDTHKRNSPTTEHCPKAIPNMAMMKEFTAAPDGLRIFDVPIRMRGASNPGGVGHIWVRDRFVTPQTRYPGAIFVPSKLKDNPSLDEKEYNESLSHLSAVTRERLMNGDWDVLEEGNMFQRHWWVSVPMSDVPTDGRAARFWDLAATTDGDYTASCRMVEKDGFYWITDVFRKQMTPHEVERTVRRTAMQDGTSTRVYIEQEPGSSGVSLMDHYRRSVLAGFYTKPVKSSTSKELRATPLSSAAEAGYIKMVQAAWNGPFMDETALFPNGSNDDQVDAAAGVFSQLARSRGSRIVA